jgi:tetratricopeptide (TPR) repeat protein
MQLRRLRPVTMVTAALCSTLVCAPLFAAGSGGGSMPSASAPQYDPAEEYRNGVAALEAQKYADAKRSFDRVLSVAPKDANANYLAGLARAGAGDLKGAIKFFQKAIKYDDGMIPAHQQLGVTFAKLGDSAKAQAELDALSARQKSCGDTCPQAADIRAAVTAVSAAMGSGPQARIETTPGIFFTSAATGDHAYQEGVRLINERRYQDAIQTFLIAQFTFGPHPDVLTWLGFANRKLGRTELAETYYRKALAAAPDHKGATEYYGELMVERGDMTGARTMLARLDASCAFGCAEAEELRRWIAAGHAPSP